MRIIAILARVVLHATCPTFLRIGVVEREGRGTSHSAKLDGLPAEP